MVDDKDTSLPKESPKIKQETENSPDIGVPDELNELLIEVVPSQKPLLAIYLLKTLGYRRMLCFVKSIDTVKRLNKLFELNNITSMEYSSSLHVARRKRVQAKFEQVNNINSNKKLLISIKILLNFNVQFQG